MNFTARILAGAAAVVWSAGAAAADSSDLRTRMAVEVDTFLSADAEHTVVWKTGLNGDFRYHGPEDYLGIRVEEARFRPLGGRWRDDQRIYLRGAGGLGSEWKWNAQVGTDGHTVLGSATVHDEARLRKEFFLEREIVESPRGVTKGIYYTFGGMALDLPLTKRDTLTVVGGVQEFTGDNVRTHVRATAVHVIDQDHGISIQLRGRYFRNSDPHEYDYYSPRWYASIVPVIQMRRWVDGWQTLVAGGVGVQRDDFSKWRRSSYFNAQLTSPPKRGWSGKAALLFSETPTVSGNNYNYVQLTVALMRAF